MKAWKRIFGIRNSERSSNLGEKAERTNTHLQKGDELVEPDKPSRPFLNKKIEDLERLLPTIQSDKKILKTLFEELEIRRTMRARSLRVRVRKILDDVDSYAVDPEEIDENEIDLNDCHTRDKEPGSSRGDLIRGERVAQVTTALPLEDRDRVYCEVDEATVEILRKASEKEAGKAVSKNLRQQELGTEHDKRDQLEENVQTERVLKPDTSFCPHEKNGNTDLLEYVLAQNVSVRLRNALKLASDTTSLPVSTVEDYLRLPPSVRRERFKRLQNIGNKSVNELEELLTNIILAPAVGSEREIHLLTGGALETGNVEKLITSLNSFDFLQLIGGVPTSPRLKTLLKKMDKTLAPHNRGLGWAIRNLDELEHQALQHQGTGRSTVKELKSRVKQAVAVVFRLVGIDDDQSEVLCETIIMNSATGVSPDVIEDAANKVSLAWEDGKISTLEVAQRASFDYDVHTELVERPNATFDRLLNDALTNRELDIVESRFGLRTQSKQTLEVIAGRYDVTRERIRQIEVKAKRKLKSPAIVYAMQLYLRIKSSGIWNELSTSGDVVTEQMLHGWQRKLSGRATLAIDVVFNEIEKYLQAFSNQRTLPSGLLIWVSPRLTEEEVEEAVSDLSKHSSLDVSVIQSIKQTIQGAKWPITLTYLSNVLPHLSREAIQRELQTNFNAVVYGDTVEKISGLSASTRLVILLRTAGHALQLAELEARHSAVFKEKMSVHAISATLQRLEEALIVDRGTYDLYENIILSPSEIAEVRDASAAVLLRENNFISAKVLFRLILPRLDDQICQVLTPYMLLGICQDDERFDCRRGLMVGLLDPQFQGQFELLDDTIEDLVRKHGPLSITEIKRRISSTREVLDTSISFSLMKNPEIIASSRGHFDMQDRVLGDEEKTTKLLNAIILSLLPGETTFPVLSVRLRSIGIDVPMPTLISFVQKQHCISRNEDRISLRDVDEAILAYERKFQEALEDQINGSLAESFLAENNLSEFEKRLQKLDFRFMMPREEWDSSGDLGDGELDLISDILSDFE